MTTEIFPFPFRPCPLEKYLTLLSGGWVVRILWHLFQPSGPRRFADLQRVLGAVSAKVLTEKLRMLEQEGIVRRDVLAGNLPQVSYSITGRGMALLPVYRAMEDASFALFGAAEQSINKFQAT